MSNQDFKKKDASYSDEEDEKEQEYVELTDKNQIKKFKELKIDQVNIAKPQKKFI
jgi:hypothetical protein